jgi:hypothetical protein
VKSESFTSFWLWSFKVKSGAVCPKLMLIGVSSRVKFVEASYRTLSQHTILAVVQRGIRPRGL